MKPTSQSRAISIRVRACFLASAAWLLLGVSSCGTADPNLFGNYAPAGGGTPSAGSPGIITGGSNSQAGSGGNGDETNAGSSNLSGSAGSGGSGAGCAFSCGEGGHGQSDSGAGGAGGSDQAGAGSEPSPECSA
ncbi:MAG TPA: hypothetical protein VHM25_06365, partial [Polyangiaceae bacterium]|nr:hypothetical protein [Polyangiaceae bacterium]